MRWVLPRLSRRRLPLPRVATQATPRSVVPVMETLCVHVVPSFLYGIDQIRQGNPITLTEPKMTRFIMSLEEAVDLVLFAFERGQNGDILIQKAPACTIQTQAEAICELFGGKKEDIKVIGIRHGEKMYETLLTKEECAKAIDMGDFYRVPADNRDLNYDQFFKEGDQKRATIEEFNSDNTRRLNLEETKLKIGSLEYIQKELNGEGNFVQ